MNKTIVAIIGILVVVGVIYYVYSMNSDGTPVVPASGTPTTTQNVQGTQQQNAQVSPNSVVLEEAVSGNFVTIESAVLSQSGYVVVYRVDSNSKTEIIGHSELLSPGTHTKFSIQLTNVISREQTIVAVMHKDDGDGKFEFPGPDLYLGSAGARLTSDVDIVDVAADKEPALLKAQVEAYLDRTDNNASTTTN